MNKMTQLFAIMLVTLGLASAQNLLGSGLLGSGLLVGEPAPIDSFPASTDSELYRCDFEEGQCGMTVQASDQGFTWLRLSGPTPSDNTGPDVDHTTQTSKGYYMYTEASDSYPDEVARLTIQPDLVNSTALLDGTDACLTFWYHMLGDHIGTLNVSMGDETLWSISGNQSYDWIQHNVTLMNYLTSGRASSNVTFVGVRGGIDIGQPYGDIAIDDVIIYAGGCGQAYTTTVQPTTTVTPTTTTAATPATTTTTPETTPTVIITATSTTATPTPPPTPTTTPTTPIITSTQAITSITTAIAEGAITTPELFTTTEITAISTTAIATTTVQAATATVQTATTATVRTMTGLPNIIQEAPTSKMSVTTEIPIATEMSAMTTTITPMATEKSTTIDVNISEPQTTEKFTSTSSPDATTEMNKIEKMTTPATTMQERTEVGTELTSSARTTTKITTTTVPTGSVFTFTSHSMTTAPTASLDSDLTTMTSLSRPAGGMSTPSSQQQVGTQDRSRPLGLSERDMIILIAFLCAAILLLLILAIVLVCCLCVTRRKYVVERSANMYPSSTSIDGVSTVESQPPATRSNGVKHEYVSPYE